MRSQLFTVSILLICLLGLSPATADQTGLRQQEKASASFETLPKELLNDDVVGMVMAALSERQPKMILDITSDPLIRLKEAFSVTSLPIQKTGLSDQDIQEALLAGREKKKSTHGLSFFVPIIVDIFSFDQIRVSLNVYTPVAWIRQLSAWAALSGETLSQADLGDEVKQPFLWITVSTMWGNFIYAERTGRSIVDSVIIANRNESIVVRPVSKQIYRGEDPSLKKLPIGKGDQLFKFPMDRIQEVRGANGDEPFFIKLLETNGAVLKKFEVKKKHLKYLP